MSRPVFKINKTIPSIIKPLDKNNITNSSNSSKLNDSKNIIRLNPIDITFTQQVHDQPLQNKSLKKAYKTKQQQNLKKFLFKELLNSKILYFRLALMPILLFQTDVYINTNNITRKMLSSKFSI